jgi:hypothetical protein
LGLSTGASIVNISTTTHNGTLIFSNEAYKKSKQNNDETGEARILISAHD